MLQNALDCREAALCIFGRRRQPPHTHFWCPCQWLKEPSKKDCFKKLYLMKAERNSPSVETLGNACLGQCGQKQLEHAHHAHLCIAGTSANAGCPCAHWSSLDCLMLHRSRLQTLLALNVRAPFGSEKLLVTQQ